MARIFVSYSRADRQFLDNFVPLIRKVYGNDSLWYDDDIHGGANWWPMILDEIAACDLFIYLISNESLASSYCHAEFEEALRLKKQILPVIVRLKTTYPGETIPHHLAVVLKRTQYVDMAEGFRDANVIASLYAAIKRLFEQVPPHPQAPEHDEPVRKPQIMDKPQSSLSIRLFVIPLIALLAIGSAVLLIAALLNIESQDSMPTVAAQEPTLETPPTWDPVAAAYATRFAEQTQSALLWTKTPTITVTPSPNVTQTFAAVFTSFALTDEAEASQQSANLTETALRWTRTPSPTATLLPGWDPITTNSDWTPFIQDFDGVEMMLVPTGCFMMGSEDGDEDERPVHPICFDEPFYIDRYEVTRTAYQDCVDTLQCANKPPLPSSNESQQPLLGANWFQARDYCGWRNSRLPSEAEWEYVARGPSNWNYPWGNNFMPDVVVYAANSGDRTAAVGSRANGVSWVGALDMSGNALEWTNTTYDTKFAYPYTTTDGRENLNKGLARSVVRGGGYHDAISELRAADRQSYSSVSASDIGFRCARNS